MSAEGQRIVASAREACPACPSHNLCPLAPIMLQTQTRGGERTPHPHAEVLGLYLSRLRRETTQLERELLEAMGGADEGNALVAGCLLAEAFWDDPGRLIRLLEGIVARGPQVRTLTPFEEQLMRAAAFLQDPAVPPLLRGRYRLKRGDREVGVYEAVRLVTRLVGGEMPEVWALEAVCEEDRPGFEASIVLREKEAGEESGYGHGAIDLFFSARTGGRSSVFYYRRNEEGRQAIVPIEAVRPDSLLSRLFKVFHTDRMKTHRLFAKIARFLNNGFKGLDKKMLWEGLKRLDREQQIVLALYAPRLGKYIEKRARFPGLYRLSKFLHTNVTDKAGEEPSHVRIFEQRGIVSDIVDLYGKETFKKFCRYVFRIAEATPDGPQWSDLIFKIGEVAYFLTAIMGFNAAGLELALGGRNPLAAVAYGLQPPAKAPGRRLARLREAERALTKAEASEKTDALKEAVATGLRYLAEIHGYESAAAMEKGLAAAAETARSASRDPERAEVPDASSPGGTASTDGDKPRKVSSR